MDSARPQQTKRELIDFGSGSSSRRYHFREKLGYDGITLTRGVLQTLPGGYVGPSQVVTVLHEGRRFGMDWCPPGSDAMRSSVVRHGAVHIADAGLPFWQRWPENLPIFAFALDQSFVEHVWQSAFDGIGDRAIRTTIAVDDPIAKHLCLAGKHELDRDGAGGRLYIDGLATALAAHLLHAHGSPKPQPTPHRGGLPPARLRRVLDFIAAHLDHDIALADLALVAELSTHHFGEAFKASVGVPPYRYVMERRVQLARELLSDRRRPLADVAYAAGFSSQGHLTTNFRRIIGTTPGRFRRLLG